MDTSYGHKLWTQVMADNSTANSSGLTSSATPFGVRNFGEYIVHTLPNSLVGSIQRQEDAVQVDSGKGS